MKKKITCVALALIMCLALFPAFSSGAFAAMKPGWVIDFDDGTTYTVSAVTPHEYIGAAGLGELWVWEEPRDWEFDVYVVDDSVSYFEQRIEFTNPKAGYFTVDAWGSFYVGDGYLELTYMSMDDFYEASDYASYYTFGRTLSFGGIYSRFFQRYDENWEGQGWLITLDIVLTKSEVAEFKNSGQLPQYLSELSPYADFTELESMLRGYGEPDTWAVAEIDAATDLGIVPDSIADGGWQNPTSRLDAADAIVAIIEKASGKTMAQLAAEKGWDLTTGGFDDTDSQAVTFLKYAGVTNGVGDNKYDPDGEYNRAQIVTMIGRAAEAFFGAEAQGENPFSDVPDYAAPYVGYAAENGITQGVGGGLFDPEGKLQNQHTAVFCYRAFNTWNA